MANNTRVTNVLQVFEEAAPAVHIPVFVGNEMFMLTQQDVRRVEDTRYLCWNRFTPNEQHNSNPNFSPSWPNVYNGTGMTPESQKSNPIAFIANVSKQINWSKTNDASPPYPITYSVATSTSECVARGADPITKHHCSCQTAPQTYSKACNTE